MSVNDEVQTGYEIMNDKKQDDYSSINHIDKFTDGSVYASVNYEDPTEDANEMI